MTQYGNLRFEVETRQAIGTVCSGSAAENATGPGAAQSDRVNSTHPPAN
jgi:hypothetical protein